MELFCQAKHTLCYDIAFRKKILDNDKDHNYSNECFLSVQYELVIEDSEPWNWYILFTH